MVTNQPDVATGRTDRATVEAMHDEIRAELAVDDIKVCAHVDADDCDCRKPKPGMLLEAAAEWGIDLAKSYWSATAGATSRRDGRLDASTLFVDYGYEQEGPMQPDRIIGSLAEAVAFILEQEHTGEIAMSTPSVERLKIKIFADGADIKAMREAAANPLIKGFTTNPTLMRAAGVTDYKAFAHEVLRCIPDRPISFEVFADDFPSMEDQALRDRLVGRQRLREDPGHQHQGRIFRPADRDAVARRREAERHRHHDAGAGRARRRGPGRERAGRRLGVCRPRCRHRPRSRAAHGRGASLAAQTARRPSCSGRARASC